MRLVSNVKWFLSVEVVVSDLFGIILFLDSTREKSQSLHDGRNPVSLWWHIQNPCTLLVQA